MEFSIWHSLQQIWILIRTYLHSTMDALISFTYAYTIIHTQHMMYTAKNRKKHVPKWSAVVGCIRLGVSMYSLALWNLFYIYSFPVLILRASRLTGTSKWFCNKQHQNLMRQVSEMSLSSPLMLVQPFQECSCIT